MQSVMVFQRIPDATFVELNEYADAISSLKNFVKAQYKRQYERLARSLMTQKKIVYKGNQRFDIIDVEFADSMKITKQKDKRAGKRHSSNNHVANQRGTSV